MITYRIIPGGKGTAQTPAGFTAGFLARISAACRIKPFTGKTCWVISIRFVTEGEMKKLNRQFRGKDRATDVLSFATEEALAVEGEREAGDLVVCPAYAEREARRRAIRPREELVRLVVHGTLHLAGMDHATEPDEARMFRLQERVVEQVMDP
jgi:probable rRNA maturation factor